MITGPSIRAITDLAEQITERHSMVEWDGDAEGLRASIDAVQDSMKAMEAASNQLRKSVKVVSDNMGGHDSHPLWDALNHLKHGMGGAGTLLKSLQKLEKERG